MPTFAERDLLWRKKRDGMIDPHFAKTLTSLSPERVDPERFGHHVSVVFERGVRTFIFSGQQNRDRFVNQFRPFGAKPCGDPLKEG